MLPAIHYIPRLAKRDLTFGPEDPQKQLAQARAILHSDFWQFQLSYGIAGGASGFMVFFLLCVFIWRRSLVDRVSLRLIFVISLFDFIQSVMQFGPPRYGPTPACRAYQFFGYFFIYASIYTSSSIALNLHMMFLRKKRSPLPRYIEYLYFAVPVSVALLHWVPQVIWAATHGYCAVIDPIDQGTKEYIVSVVCVQMLLPTIFLAFNLVTSTRVIVSLLRKQRQISSTLRDIAQENRSYLYTSEYTAVSGVSGIKKGDMEATSEKERLLRISRKVNSAAIRIALYPFAPLAWWIMIVVFYRVQYDLTMTFKSDVPKFVRMLKLSWYSSSAAAFVNFLVFLTDPAVLGVIREVRRAIADKLLRRRGLAKVAPQQQPDQSALCDRSPTLHGSHVSKALNHHDSDSTASLGLAKEARYDLAGAERGDVGLVNTALRYGDDDDGCSNTTTIAQL